MRIGRAGHVAHHAGQVEAQHALVLRSGQVIGPQAGGARIVLHQRHLRFLAAGQAQVIDGLPVDIEHRGGGAVFGAHVGDGGAVTDGQCRRPLAEEFKIRTHHAFLAQELGQCQHHVGGGDARLWPAGQLDADDIRQAHPRRAAQHHVLRFQAANTNRDHTQRVDVRGVAIGAHAGIREGYAVLHVDHRRHLLQVDLVHDAVARRNHVHVLERLLGPVDEVETVFVAAILDGAVLLERLRIVATAFHRQRVIDDQLHRHHRIDLGRVAALVGDRITQAGQVHQRGLAEDVVAHHACREPREVEVATALDQLLQRIAERGRIASAHQVLGQHARGVRQGGIGAGLDRIDSGARVEIVQRAAGEVLAVIGIHGLAECLGRAGCRRCGGESTRPACGRPDGYSRGIRRACRWRRSRGLPDRCNWRSGG